MLIAITAKENSLQAEIDPRFGRAAFYIIVDTENGEITAHDNSDGINASNGAGTGAAQTLSEYGVETLYTGRVGPKAAVVLNQAKIQYYENVSGTVQDLLEKLEQGKSEGAPTQARTDPAVPPIQQQADIPGTSQGPGRGAGRKQGSGRGMDRGRWSGTGGGRGRGQGPGQGRGACDNTRTDTGQSSSSPAPTGYSGVQTTKYHLTK